MANQKRDALREVTIGSNKNFKKEIVEVNGKELEVRQPSVADRDKLIERCKPAGSDDISWTDFMIWNVILNTYVPGTNERVFEDGDYESLRNQPTNSFLDEIANVANRLAGAENDSVKKPESE